MENEPQDLESKIEAARTVCDIEGRDIPTTLPLVQVHKVEASEKTEKLPFDL